MREIKCKWCGTISLKYEHDGKHFCNRDCYMAWKRLNPNKKAYRDKVMISGYYYIYYPNHPCAIKGRRYVAEHRLIAEQKLGRYLNSNEVAHHINGNTLDNTPSNIEILTSSQHNKTTANSRRRDLDGKFAVSV